MPREMTEPFAAAVGATVVYPVFLIDAEFDSQTLSLWSGIGDLTVAGTDYLGAGRVLQMILPQETGEIEAQNATFQLSGVQEGDIALTLLEDYQGRPVRVRMGLFDADGALMSDIIRLFSGLMDVMTVNDDPDDPVITMTAESDLVRLNRAKLRHRTHEDQQIDYAGDRFFEFVPAMQHAEIKWGKP